MNHSIKLCLFASLLVLFAVALFSFFLFRSPGNPPRFPAVLYSGSDFHLHKEIELLVTSPSGLSVLTDVQVSNLLRNYELVLPTGLRLENESIGIFSTTRGALLDVDGILRIPPEVPPGTKTIKLRLPGMMEQASNLGTKVTLQTNAEKTDGPCVWIVFEFQLASDSTFGKDPSHRAVHTNSSTNKPLDFRVGYPTPTIHFGHDRPGSHFTGVLPTASEFYRHPLESVDP